MSAKREKDCPIRSLKDLRACGALRVGRRDPVESCANLAGIWENRSVNYLTRT